MAEALTLADLAARADAVLQRHLLMNVPSTGEEGASALQGPAHALREMRASALTQKLGPDRLRNTQEGTTTRASAPIAPAAGPHAGATVPSLALAAQPSPRGPARAVTTAATSARHPTAATGLAAARSPRSALSSALASHQGLSAVRTTCPSSPSPPSTPSELCLSAPPAAVSPLSPLSTPRSALTAALRQAGLAGPPPAACT